MAVDEIYATAMRENRQLRQILCDVLKALADQHGTRYRTADEEGLAFDKHAVLDFARALLTSVVAEPVAMHPKIDAAVDGVMGLVMADGSPLLDYLNVGDDPPNTDEWTKGFHEARRRLYRILAPQITAGVLGPVHQTKADHTPMDSSEGVEKNRGE